MKISDTVLLEGCLTFVVCSHWERSLLYPSWAFPLGDSEHTDVARYLDFSSRSPRIPLSTQRRLQLGLCVGVVALGEGFLGIPSDALQSSGQYRAVWYDPTDEYPGPKDDRHVVTAAQLAQPLSEHPSFPSKCILIIPTNQQDLRQPQEAIVKTLAEEWAKRTNVSRGVETSCLKDVQSIAGGKCVLTHTTYATESAHILALALGTDIFRAVTQSLTKATATSTGSFSGPYVFADSRLPGEFLFNDEVTINDVSNGYTLAADIHRCLDTRKLVPNPVDGRVLLLDYETAEEGRLVADCAGFLDRGTLTALADGDPRKTWSWNVDGKLRTAPDKSQAMLMALGLFLTFAQRYMTRKRKSDIRTEVKAVITKALSGGDTSRVITEGNAEGSSTSQRQAGGGAAVEGEQARGGLEGTMTIHASNLGESVYTYTLVAEETTSRKRPRAGATLLTSASAESARALVNTSSGERGRKRPRTSKIGLKPYLEEMIFPTDLSDDNEDERDQLFDALVKEYPYQYRAGTDVEDLHQYHLQILWDRTLLLRIAYLVR